MTMTRIVIEDWRADVDPGTREAFSSYCESEGGAVVDSDGDRDALNRLYDRWCALSDAERAAWE
jgi:hypothetical protein